MNCELELLLVAIQKNKIRTGYCWALSDMHEWYIKGVSTSENRIRLVI